MIPHGHQLVRVHLVRGVAVQSRDEKVRVQFRYRPKDQHVLLFRFPRLTRLGNFTFFNDRRGLVHEQQALFETRRPLFQRLFKDERQEACFFRGGRFVVVDSPDRLDFGKLGPLLLERGVRVERGKDRGRRLADMFVHRDLVSGQTGNRFLCRGRLLVTRVFLGLLGHRLVVCGRRLLFRRGGFRFLGLRIRRGVIIRRSRPFLLHAHRLDVLHGRVHKSGWETETV